MKLEWIKICLNGNNPVLGTIQGRVENLTEEGLNELIEKNKPFKLHDIIVIQPTMGQDGRTTLGVSKLTEGLGIPPDVQTEYVMMNSANIAWWAAIKVDAQWQNIIAQAIYGVQTATAADLQDLERGSRGGLILP